MLKQIGKEDVQKITSGQVIISLLSLVKEIIENSIDAGSDIIEVSFKQSGLDGIEINDNGHGIRQEDFETICLKHYTSKIQKFEDLELVKTLGFRGEALSSICSVADVKIVTSTKEMLPHSYELTYNNMGELTSQEKVLNKRTELGVRLIIGELFKQFPVRQKNFVKNIKREFSKMLLFVYNYIIINPQIKFVITNIVNDKKKVLITTQKTNSLLNNFIIIYGTKSIDSLKPIELTVSDNFKVSGYISSLSIGKGRSVKDKQHLFLNNRPIVHKEVSKLINEVYNQFNNLQYPVFVLNLQVEADIDVNLTPDKTLINFKQDFNQLRDALVKYWEVENMGQQLKVNLSHDDSSPAKPLPTTAPARPKASPGPIPVKRLKLSNYLQDEMFKTNNLKTTLQTHDITITKPRKRSRTLKQVDDTTDTPLVEHEITVNKLQFKEMELIGQFNLGFVLTKLDNNLFIVDQHASDEKHNYEDLKNQFKVDSQPLIDPANLNLNLIEKQKIVEFKAIIEHNGFRLNEQYLITHLPVYKNIQFTKDDLLELLAVLPQQSLVPKIASVLALKACRKSIMIGQHLSRQTMRSIVDNLSTLDKPWNCPHGRPTLRHLYNLDSTDPTDWDCLI